MNTEKKTSGIMTFEDLEKSDPFGFKKDPETPPAGEEDKSSLKNENKEDQDDPEKDKPKGGDNDIDREKQTSPSGTTSSVTSDLYRSHLKKLFGDNIQTIVQTVGDEEVETPIDELEIDEELYLTIVKAEQAREREEATRDTISLKDASDFTKTLLEIEKRGGNVTQLLEAKRDFIDPLDAIDMTTTEGQKKAITIRLLAADRKPEEIEAQIKYYEDRGELETKATQFEQEIRESVADYFAKRKQEAIDLEAKKKEDLKTYRKSVKESIEKQFQLKDTIVAKLVDFATKPDSNQQFLMDQALTEARKDPIRAAKLALWLADEAEYEAQISSKKVSDTKRNTALKLGTIRKSAEEGDDFARSGGGQNSKDFIAFEED